MVDSLYTTHLVTAALAHSSCVCFVLLFTYILPTYTDVVPNIRKTTVQHLADLSTPCSYSNMKEIIVLLLLLLLYVVIPSIYTQ